MKIGNTIQDNYILKNTLAGSAVLLHFILILWGISSILGDLIKLENLTSFTALVFFYVIVASSAAFTFLIIYLLDLFTRKDGSISSTKKILIMFFLAFVILINAATVHFLHF